MRADKTGEAHGVLHPAMGSGAIHRPKGLIGVLPVPGVVDEFDHLQQLVRHRNGPMHELPPLQRPQRDRLGDGIEVKRCHLQRFAEPGAGQGKGKAVGPRRTRFEELGGGDKGPPLLGGQILAQTARGEEAGHGATLRDRNRGVNGPARSTGKSVWRHRIPEIRRVDQGSRFRQSTRCNIILG